MGGRQREIAAALGGEPAIFFPLGDAPGWAKPLRYLLSLLQSSLYLARRQPRAVIVSNPPIFAALPAFAYGAMTGAPILLDSHPGGFGLQGDRLSARLQPLHRRLAARARATLVTEERLAASVRAWGGRGEVIHEAPPHWDAPPPRAAGSPYTVLFVCTFQRDEPVQAVLDAARLRPDVRIRVTGDPGQAPVAPADLPANVELTGFLAPDAYRSALFAADAALVLTTEPASVVRGGYEAVWAHRPLIVSDWPTLRHVFPDAVFTGATGPEIANAIELSRSQHDALAAVAPEARRRQLERWERQLEVLEQAIGAPA